MSTDYRPRRDPAADRAVRSARWLAVGLPLGALLGLAIAVALSGGL